LFIRSDLAPLATLYFPPRRAGIEACGPVDDLLDRGLDLHRSLFSCWIRIAAAVHLVVAFS
jgi:hypothetical protein